MSQANWDRSTIGGAGTDASRRRVLGAVAAGLAAGLAAGFIAGFASGAMAAWAPTSLGPIHAWPGLGLENRVEAERGQAGLSAAA